MSPAEEYPTPGAEPEGFDWESVARYRALTDGGEALPHDDAVERLTGKRPPAWQPEDMPEAPSAPKGGSGSHSGRRQHSHPSQSFESDRVDFAPPYEQLSDEQKAARRQSTEGNVAAARKVLEPMYDALDRWNAERFGVSLDVARQYRLDKEERRRKNPYSE